MTPDEQAARSLRFSGHASCILTRTPASAIALHEWGGTGNLLYCGRDWDELRKAFLARPEWSYRPAPPKPKLVAGINIADLEIDL